MLISMLKVLPTAKTWRMTTTRLNTSIKLRIAKLIPVVVMIIPMMMMVLVVPMMMAAVVVTMIIKRRDLMISMRMHTSFFHFSSNHFFTDLSLLFITFSSFPLLIWFFFLFHHLSHILYVERTPAGVLEPCQGGGCCDLGCPRSHSLLGCGSASRRRLHWSPPATSTVIDTYPYRPIAIDSYRLWALKASR